MLLVSTSVTTFLLSRRRSLAIVFSDAISWLSTLWQLVPHNIQDMFNLIDRLKLQAHLVVDDRDRLEDLRRRLTDPTSEIRTAKELDTWLQHYQQYIDDISNGQKKPESKEAFADRMQRQHVLLEK